MLWMPQGWELNSLLTRHMVKAHSHINILSMGSTKWTSVTHTSLVDYSDVQKFTDEGVMDDYMSPYMQAVVDRQKKPLRMTSKSKAYKGKATLQSKQAG